MIPNKTLADITNRDADGVGLLSAAFYPPKRAKVDDDKVKGAANGLLPFNSAKELIGRKIESVETLLDDVFITLDDKSVLQISIDGGKTVVKIRKPKGSV